MPLQQKIPIRLDEKLRECSATVVGLDFIHEIIACSSPEVEPYYKCILCGNQGEANGMYSHLFGRKHRQKFLEEMFPDNSR